MSRFKSKSSQRGQCLTTFARIRFFSRVRRFRVHILCYRASVRYIHTHNVSDSLSVIIDTIYIISLLSSFINSLHFARRSSSSSSSSIVVLPNTVSLVLFLYTYIYSFYPYSHVCVASMPPSSPPSSPPLLSNPHRRKLVVLVSITLVVATNVDASVFYIRFDE